MNLFDLAERVAVAIVSNDGIELGIAKGLTPGGRVAQGPLRQIHATEIWYRSRIQFTRRGQRRRRTGTTVVDLLIL